MFITHERQARVLVFLTWANQYHHIATDPKPRHMLELPRCFAGGRAAAPRRAHGSRRNQQERADLARCPKREFAAVFPSQSPASRKFCLASGGYKPQQTRPWLGLVGLSRTPSGTFFREANPALLSWKRGIQTPTKPAFQGLCGLAHTPGRRFGSRPNKTSHMAFPGFRLVSVIQAGLKVELFLGRSILARK